MYFFFLLTAALGGFIGGRGFADGDAGIGVLGLIVAVISVIACGFIGFPL